MRLWLTILALASGLAFAGVAPGPVFGSGAAIGTSGGGGGGATQIINCPTGFGGIGCNSSVINLAGTGPIFSGSDIILNNAQHSAGAMWWTTQENVNSWTTDFTFQTKPDSVSGESFTGPASPSGTTSTSVGPYTHQATPDTEVVTIKPGTVTITVGGITATDNGSGVISGTGISSGHVYYASGDMSFTLSSPPTNGTAITVSYQAAAFGVTFCVQNTNATTNPQAYGDSLSSDANGLGYGALEHLSQVPVANSFAVKFDNTSFNGTTYIGETPSTTGLYLAGGPDVGSGMAPAEDMNPSGVLPLLGNVISAHLVYDGTYLTLVAKDETTGAQYREVWPLAAATVVGSTLGWFGITGGTVTAGPIQVLSWDLYSGYNTRLATPTFSPAPGQYSTSQTVTISCPSGATCYYTTNGRLPTTADTQYTGPITVSSNEVIQAVATETNYTDSYVGTGNYQIQASGPTINFPSGFASASNLITVNGGASFNGSSIQLSEDTENYSQLDPSGSSWYAVPVSVNGFTTTFTLQFPNSTSSGYGMTFALQNYLPSSQDQNARTGPQYVSGGPNALAGYYTDFGYGGAYGGILSSVAVGFDLYGSGGNACLISEVTDGATPGGGIGTSMSPVNCHDGNPLQVTLSYNNSTTTLSATVKECTTSACTTIVNTYSTSWTVDIPTVVGGNTAYVGFTGAASATTTGLDVTTWTGF